MDYVENLKSYIDQLNLEIVSNSLSDLNQEVNELVKSGGKKFRPGLLYLMGMVFDLSPEILTPYARAVELTHLASLIHDDVIDSSDKRRNHTTLNALKSNTTAILAGDYVLSTVMGELAELNRNELLVDLTECIKDLADGEWLQHNLKTKEQVTESDLETVCLKKTGSLIRYACTTPAKLAQYSDPKSMQYLGERIGLIFQMADDIVDGFSFSGRPAFQDIQNGQMNYVTLELIRLFPNLKEKIYDMRRNGNGNPPWSKDQYLQAVRAVHEKIKKEKKDLIEIFNHLCELKNKKKLLSIFELSLSRIQTNYLDHLDL